MTRKVFYDWMDRSFDELLKIGAPTIAKINNNMQETVTPGGVFHYASLFGH